MKVDWATVVLVLTWAAVTGACLFVPNLREAVAMAQRWAGG